MSQRRSRSGILSISMAGVAVIALAAGAGAVTPESKSQERLFHPDTELCVAAGGDACPVVQKGELVEHGVRYSTIVIMNADQERTTLLRIRGAI